MVIDISYLDLLRIQNAVKEYKRSFENVAMHSEAAEIQELLDLLQAAKDGHRGK